MSSLSSRTYLSRRFAAVAVMAAFSLPVLAQPAPMAAPMGAASSPGMAHEGHKPGGNMMERHQAYQAKRLGQLKEKLQLTPAQEPAWATFTAAMKPTEGHARMGGGHEGMDKLTTPERIDRMRALRAQYAAEADKRGDATKAFYATLTPAQQKTLDAHSQRGHRMLGGHGDRGPGHHGGHHGMHGGDKPAQ